MIDPGIFQTNIHDVLRLTRLCLTRRSSSCSLEHVQEKSPNHPLCSLFTASVCQLAPDIKTMTASKLQNTGSFINLISVHEAGLCIQMAAQGDTHTSRSGTRRV